jgi:hypothetical protein
VINPEELAICKRRGHDGGYDKAWSQCKWCGMWLRTVKVIEEREDEPPQAEQDQLHRLAREAEKRAG